MNIFKVQLLNLNKNMEGVIFVQASQVNGAKYRWNKVWYEFILL